MFRYHSGNGPSPTLGYCPMCGREQLVDENPVCATCEVPLWPLSDLPPSGDIVIAAEQLVTGRGYRDFLPTGPNEWSWVCTKHGQEYCGCPHRAVPSGW